MRPVPRRARRGWCRRRERGAGDGSARAQPLFTGGWFLYLGYELAAEIEPTLRLPRSRAAARSGLAHARRAAARPASRTRCGSSRETPALERLLQRRSRRHRMQSREAAAAQARPAACRRRCASRSRRCSSTACVDVLDAIAARRRLPGQPVALVARAPGAWRHGDRSLPRLATRQSRAIRRARAARRVRRAQFVARAAAAGAATASPARGRSPAPVRAGATLRPTQR